MSADPIELARASYRAFITKDRAAIEALLAPDFHFTSPLDDRIDREAYFERCWPNNAHLADFDFERIVAAGDQVVVTYVARTTDGRRFRNTEVLKVRGAHIVEVEVYFGWSIPHELTAVPPPPTCGAGVAQHAAIPAKLGEMFAALAETLALHRQMLRLEDPVARREDDVYAELAASWRDLADRVRATAARMAAQSDLPMGAHDESAWGPEHLRAFAAFVKAQSEALALLKIAGPRDEQLLASMQPQQA